MLKETAVFLALVCIGLASIGEGPLEEKPDKFKDVEGCYISVLDKVIPYGETAPAPVEEGCFEYYCLHTKVQFEACALFDAMYPCYVEVNNTLRYPDCCPKLRCIDVNDDGN